MNQARRKRMYSLTSPRADHRNFNESPFGLFRQTCATTFNLSLPPTLYRWPSYPVAVTPFASHQGLKTIGHMPRRRGHRSLHFIAPCFRNKENPLLLSVLYSWMTRSVPILPSSLYTIFSLNSLMARYTNRINFLLDIYR